MRGEAENAGGEKCEDGTSAGGAPVAMINGTFASATELAGICALAIGCAVRLALAASATAIRPTNCCTSAAGAPGGGVEAVPVAAAAAVCCYCR
jgi:hypothetical protein